MNAEVLDPGEWWANLSAEDLSAFLEAAAQQRLVDQERTVARWFEQAPPLQFAYQLVMAGQLVQGAARNVAFSYLLRIGLEAAPAVEEWLVVPTMAAWGRLWFDLIGAPRPGVPTEQERAHLAADLNRAGADLLRRLDPPTAEVFAGLATKFVGAGWLDGRSTDDDR